MGSTGVVGRLVSIMVPAASVDAEPPPQAESSAKQAKTAAERIKFVVFMKTYLSPTKCTVGS